MNHYWTSKGDRVSKSQIDKYIHQAKARKLDKHLSEYGYVFCEDCGVNSNAGLPIDISHDISVDQCQKDPKTPLELAWDEKNNMKFRCRKCHQKHDKTL